LLKRNNGDDDGEIHKIIGHRLSYKQISQQQEQTQPRGWNAKGKAKTKEYSRPYAILMRGVMIEPRLFLGFENEEDAIIASKQHICLCRNEDLLYPSEEIVYLDRMEFDTNEDLYAGFELDFVRDEESFLVGYNRFKENTPMYGSLKIVGTPVKSNY